MSQVSLQDVAAALERRGFATRVFANRADAAAFVLEAAASAKVVGMGGAETVKQLGVVDELSRQGRELVRETPCDLFLLSANALTADGRIVNIDGFGNRVAASIHGAGHVLYVIGRNKIVDGGIDATIERIKRCACPPNCRRLGKKTPCAATGVCADCDSPDRICKVTVVMDRRPTGTQATVALVDDDLGY